jgi:hypothetical protein
MNPFIFNAPNGKSGSQDQRKQALIAQIMGQGAPNPTTTTQGAMNGLNSIMGGFALRNQNEGAFPAAPSGGKPSFGQGLMNFFGAGGGGIY